MGTRKRPIIRWHRLLAEVLKELLMPLGVQVFSEFSVMEDAPKADILLLRENVREWTPAQSERLPDGLRDCQASHILIEFKYSESVGLKPFRQALAYYHFYVSRRGLADAQVSIFIASARTPRKETLSRFLWLPTDKPGVYQSENPMLEPVCLIILNELSDEPHNAWFKCFASRKQERKTAFQLLKDNKAGWISTKLVRLLQGLWRFWFSEGGDFMKHELTPEDFIEAGEALGRAYLSSLPVEDIVKAVGAENILNMLGPEEIRAYLRKLDEKEIQKNSD